MLIAGLSWYKIQPEKLDRCVRSLKDRADAIVAVDGPYRGLSDDPCAGYELYDVIAKAAEESHLQYRIYEGEVYDSEPVKRTAVARAALECLPEFEKARGYESMKPYLFVIDSDEWLRSEIDWGLVDQQGMGTITLMNYRDGVPVEESSGATMKRIFPLSDSLTWGPLHFDVRDDSRVYLGWGGPVNSPDEPCAEMGHELSEKVIEKEYYDYNDGLRAEHEGRMMRVVKAPAEHGGNLIVMRMDQGQYEAGWRLGELAHFPPHMTGPDSSGVASLDSALPTEIPGVVDLTFRLIEDEEELRARQMLQAQARRLRDEEAEKRQANRERRVRRRGGVLAPRRSDC